MKKIHMEYYLNSLKNDLNDFILYLEDGMKLLPFKDYLNIDIMNLSDSEYIELFQKFIDNWNMTILNKQLDNLIKKEGIQQKVYNKINS